MKLYSKQTPLLAKKQFTASGISLCLIVFILMTPACQKKSSAAEKGATGKKIPLVKTMPAGKKKLVSFIDITGTIQANMSTEVKSPADGIIESLMARENQWVKKDKIIAVINPHDRVTLIAKSQFNIQQIEQKMAAAKESAVKLQLTAELEKARQDLAYANKMIRTIPVICPMNGLITQRWLDQGSWVGSKEKILTISDMNSLVIKTEVNEKYFTAIQSGNTLSLTLSAYPLESFIGKIKMIYPLIDSVTRSLKFDIQIENSGKKLIPGMMASIRIPTQEVENAVFVPEHAVLTAPDNVNFLFVADEHETVHRRVVETGTLFAGKLHILQGLNENEQVVIMGQEMLKDNMQVKIAKPLKTEKPLQ